MAEDPHRWLATNANGQDKDPYGQGKASPRGLSTYGGSAAYNGDNGYVESSAETAARDYRNQGAASNNRQGVQLNYGGADQNFGNAMESRGLAYGARNSQQDALGLAQSAAYGKQPSAAEIQGRNMIQGSLRAQMAGAAGARGGAEAQMAAQRGVQQGAAGFQQQGINQLSALRANEMANARNAYAGQAGAIRSGDQAQGAQDLQAAGQHAQMAQAQGSMDMGQRQLNQQNQQFYDQLGHGVREGEANRGVQSANIEAENWRKQTDTNRGSKRDSQGLAMGIVDTFGSVLGALRAKGGPAVGGKAYLVGEEGPELIVPREDGFVLTADQTKQALSYGGAREGGGPVEKGKTLPSTMKPPGGAKSWFRDFVSFVRDGKPKPAGQEAEHTSSLERGASLEGAGPSPTPQAGVGTPPPAAPKALDPEARRLGDDVEPRALGGLVEGMSGPAPASFSESVGASMNPRGELKAHSDFATRFRGNPGGFAYGGARASGGKVLGMGEMLDDRAGIIASQPVDPQTAQMLTDRYEQQQEAPTSGVPYWLEKAAADGQLSGSPAPTMTGQEITDAEYSARPMSLTEHKAKMPDKAYALQYGKSNAPSMGDLAKAGKGADAGATPIKAKAPEKSNDWRRSIGLKLKGALQ